MGFLALEGGVCSGKSTLLAKATQEDVGIVREYMDFLPADHPCHSILLPPLERLSLFFGIESKRMKDAGELVRHTVADRCILSLIAFELALMEMGEKSELVSFASSSDLTVALPDRVLFLEISDALRLDRWCRRGFFSDSIFVLPKFNASIRKSVVKAALYTRVDVVEASALTHAELYEVFDKSLRELSPWTPTKRVLLHEMVSNVIA